MRILAKLNECFPSARNEIEQGVQDLLGPMNEETVHQAVEALQAGDAEQLGALMVKAQARFDRYAMPACPEELTAPVLHRVLEYEPLQPHIWGGKGVGSQGDGAAQFIARSEADQQAIVDIVEQELGMPCFKVSLRDGAGSTAAPSVAEPVQVHTAPAPGHDIQPVRTAVIPVAGLGTRLFPATWATKKEFFPIVDRNGIAKPAILLIIEEALGAGIERVIMIVQEQDLNNFQALFGGSTITQQFDRYPAHLQAYAQRIVEMGRHVSFAVQYTQEGFGHAVYSAREAVGDEPFLLMLGDHLYQTNSAKSCARQLLEVYNHDGRSVLGLRRVQERDVVHYGTACGKWLQEMRLLEIMTIAEKPTVDQARAHLRVPGLPEREYLAFFGQYLLKPRVFDFLEENIANDRREGGEFELTTVLDRLRREDGFLGLVMDGQCYDIGLPEAYLRTLRALGPQ
jgi:UTP-glucose-1-phosphate uridylyltransferase